jgi:hypothetical protein
MNDNANIMGPSSSPETGELTAALAKAQAEYQHVALDSANPHFRSKFSSYAQCCDSLRGPLTKNGLALPDFRPGLSGSQWVLVGTLRHSSGQYITGIAPLLTAKSDMQAFGAAVTYAKRTLLMALTGGFSGEPDDDGNSLQPEMKKPVEVRPAQTATKSMEIEAAATKELAAAKKVEDAQKVVDRVKLRVSQKVCDAKVLQRLQAAFDAKFPMETVTNG